MKGLAKDPRRTQTVNCTMWGTQPFICGPFRYQEIIVSTADHCPPPPQFAFKRQRASPEMWHLWTWSQIKDKVCLTGVRVLNMRLVFSKRCFLIFNTFSHPMNFLKDLMKFYFEKRNVCWAQESKRQENKRIPPPFCSEYALVLSITSNNHMWDSPKNVFKKRYQNRTRDMYKTSWQ